MGKIACHDLRGFRILVEGNEFAVEIVLEQKGRPAGHTAASTFARSLAMYARTLAARCAMAAASDFRPARRR